MKVGGFQARMIELKLSYNHIGCSLLNIYCMPRTSHKIIFNIIKISIISIVLTSMVILESYSVSQLKLLSLDLNLGI